MPKTTHYELLENSNGESLNQSEINPTPNLEVLLNGFCMEDGCTSRKNNCRNEFIEQTVAFFDTSASNMLATYIS